MRPIQCPLWLHRPPERFDRKVTLQRLHRQANLRHEHNRPIAPFLTRAFCVVGCKDIAAALCLTIFLYLNVLLSNTHHNMVRPCGYGSIYARPALGSDGCWVVVVYHGPLDGYFFEGLLLLLVHEIDAKDRVHRVNLHHNATRRSNHVSQHRELKPSQRVQQQHSQHNS